MVSIPGSLASNLITLMQAYQREGLPTGGRNFVHNGSEGDLFT